MIEISRSKTEKATASVPKEDLIEILSKNIEDLKNIKAIGDSVEINIVCWNSNGSKVCDDISRIEVMITRERTI